MLFPLSRRLLSSSSRTFSSTAFRNNAINAQEGVLEGERLISAKLSDKFNPSQLKVQDVSNGCGTFYAITIASDAFKGLSIVKQHKLVTETLKQEIEGIHGLQIKTIAQ